MVKILNCKIKVAKKFEKAVKSITRIKEQKIYEIILNDNYQFDYNNKKEAIAFTSKQVTEILNTIVEIVQPQDVESVLSEMAKDASTPSSSKKISAKDLDDAKKSNATTVLTSSAKKSLRNSKIINQYINKSGKLVTVYSPTGKFVKRNKSVKKSRTPKVKASKVNVINREIEEMRFISAFLKGSKTMKQLVSKHSQKFVIDTMSKYNLKSYNYANFKGLSDTKIYATLKFYKRFDLIEMLEKSFVLVA